MVTPHEKFQVIKLKLEKWYKEREFGSGFPFNYCGLKDCQDLSTALTTLVPDCEQYVLAS